MRSLVSMSAGGGLVVSVGGGAVVPVGGGGAVVVVGVDGQPIATRLMTNNNANGISNSFLFNYLTSLLLLVL